MFFLKIVGLIKTIAILVIVFLVIRFIGRLMAARQAAEAAKKDEREKNLKTKNQGKVSIARKTNKEAEDIDYTEVT